MNNYFLSVVYMLWYAIVILYKFLVFKVNIYQEKYEYGGFNCNDDWISPSTIAVWKIRLENGKAESWWIS